MKFYTSTLKLGIIAGGQLGKMLIQEASKWDIATYVLDEDEKGPASSIATCFFKGSRLDYQTVYDFGKKVDILTFEIESINVDALFQLQKEGIEVIPDPSILQLFQNKEKQKEFYVKNGLPTARYMSLSPSPSLQDSSFESTPSVLARSLPRFSPRSNLHATIHSPRPGEVSHLNQPPKQSPCHYEDLEQITFPFVQKLKTGGYDGRGVAVIRDENDLVNLLEGDSIIEELVDIHKEIAVIVARNKDGEVRCFPAVEMVFNEKANLVEKLICPANITPEESKEAEAIATKLITDLNMQGILAIEFFVVKDCETLPESTTSSCEVNPPVVARSPILNSPRSNRPNQSPCLSPTPQAGNYSNRILINESAPRPHNSGHHTIESIMTSQYEQHLRAILNLPLGSTEIKMPSVMLNILGKPDYEGPVYYEWLKEALAIEGVKIHLYGKKITKPFRKMGHITILDKDIKKALEKGEQIINYKL